MLKRRLIVAIALVLALASFAPSMAAWGAGWGSGSVNGYSIGKVPYANGTGVKAMVAPPGCKGHGDREDDRDDEHCGRESRDGGAIQANVLRSGAADPTVLTGAVFCKRTNGFDEDDRNQVLKGSALATVKVNIKGDTTVQNNGFAIHITVPQSVLNRLDSVTLCAGLDVDDVGSTWQIIDFVPQAFFARLHVGHDTRIFSCVMKPADFDALKWDQGAWRPSSEPYQC